MSYLGHAVLLAGLVTLLATVFNLINPKNGVEKVLVAGAATAVVMSIVNLPLMWWGRPVIALNSASFYRSWWLWMIELLIAIVVVGFAAGAGDEYDFSPSTGSVILGVAWVLVFVYGILNMFGGVWTQNRATELAHEVTVVKAKIGDYPPTDANHMVIVPEQVARKSASVAISSTEDNLSTNYELMNPILQAVENHAYWIVPLRASGWINSNRVHGVVPAYIAVDAENPSQPATVHSTDATGQKLSIHYTKGGFFGSNLQRHVWSSGYAGTPVDHWTMEVDDQWRPFWTASVNRLTLNFKRTTPKGLLTVDAQSGAVHQYSLKEMPTWVDRVYSADTAKQLVDWWGNYGSSNYAWAFRGSADRYQVDGTPTLVYTKEGYPVWQMELTSKNNDSSVSYMALFNGREHTVRLYRIPDVALESSVINAVEGSSDNIRKLTPVHLSMHKIYGKLTWVAALVPHGEGKASDKAIMQGIALAPADTQLSGGDIVIAKTMSLALNEYQTFLNGTASVKPSEDASVTVVTGIIDRLSTPLSEKGSNAYYFTLVGDPKHSYRVNSDPMADNANQEVPFIKSGAKITIGYRDSGTVRRDVQSYDDLSLNLG